MTATLIELPIQDRIQNAVAIFKKQDVAIAAMKTECLLLKIAGVDDKDGYTKVYESRQTAKRLRVAVGKKAKAMRDEATRDGKALAAAIDEEDDRITAELKTIEEYLQKQEDDYEAAREKIKADKAAAAQLALQKRIDRLTEARCPLPEISFLRDIDADNWELYFAKAVEVQAERERLAQVEADRVAAEQAIIQAEQSRLEAAAKAEQERVAAEKQAQLDRQAEANRIERDRLAKEREATLHNQAVERAALEAERAELKRQAQRIEELQEAERQRVEAENAERIRVRDEEIRKDEAERNAREIALAEAEELAATASAIEAAKLEVWERKLLDLTIDCLRDADKGLDVLVSHGWDMVLGHWRTRPQ